MNTVHTQGQTIKNHRSCSINKTRRASQALVIRCDKQIGYARWTRNRPTGIGKRNNPKYSTHGMHSQIVQTYCFNLYAWTESYKTIVNVHGLLSCLSMFPLNWLRDLSDSVHRNVRHILFIPHYPPYYLLAHTASSVRRKNGTQSTW